MTPSIPEVSVHHLAAFVEVHDHARLAGEEDLIGSLFEGEAFRFEGVLQGLELVGWDFLDRHHFIKNPSDDIHSFRANSSECYK